MTARSLVARDRAIYRGLCYIERNTRRPETIFHFGSAVLYALCFMATTSLDCRVRSYARQLALRNFRHWKWIYPDLPHDIDANTVSEFVHACGALERLGVRFPRLKPRLRAAAKRFDTIDYLWFDPHRELPPADVPEPCPCGSTSPRRRRRCINAECGSALGRMSRLRLWTLSLTSVFCGDRNGVRFGIGYENMMRWLPYMRGYRGPGRDIGAFYDSVYAISHVVYTLNDYGVWLLDPGLLPHEFEFLIEHFGSALAIGDPDMVGEFMDSLRAFGLGNDDAHIEAGTEFLVVSQNKDGSWGSQDKGMEYPRFHATWAALDGLRDFAWRGYGLSYPRLTQALKKWARQPAAAV